MTQQEEVWVTVLTDPNCRSMLKRILGVERIVIVSPPPVEKPRASAEKDGLRVRVATNYDWKVLT